jgi:hypothetical protein
MVIGLPDPENATVTVAVRAPSEVFAGLKLTYNAQLVCP